MDIQEDDVNIRADRYKDTLRLYFSHEGVEGIMLWGFWDQAHSKPEAALAGGPEVTVSNLLSENFSNRHILNVY